MYHVLEILQYQSCTCVDRDVLEPGSSIDMPLHIEQVQLIKIVKYIKDVAIVISVFMEKIVEVAIG